MKNTIGNTALFALSLLSLSLLLSLSGCASPQMQTQNTQMPTRALGNAEFYTYQLAQELFLNMIPDRQYRYAVAGFVPVDTLKNNPNNQGPLMLLGQQLEQGLMTEAVKRGFVAQDYKATNSIIISADADRVLSRNVEELTAVQRVDFYITGTITHQQSGAMVNARVIDARSKDVVAAASTFFPIDLFWENEQVTTRNGRLYRVEKTAPGASI